MDRKRIFHICKAKALLHSGIAVLFFFVGVSMIDERPLFGWFSALLFGGFGLFGVLRLLTDIESLCLDNYGIEVTGIFGRNRFLWKEIKSIRLTAYRGVPFIAIDFENSPHRRSKDVRSLARMDAKIANIYEVSLSELFAVLKEWHERYGKTT